MLKELYQRSCLFDLGLIHSWEQAIIDKNSLVYNVPGNFTAEVLNADIFNQQFCYNTIMW